MERLAATRLRDAHGRMDRLNAQLAALNPRSILRRGYSITIDPATGQALRAAGEARPGQPLRVLLHDGNIDVRVDGGPVERPPAPRRGGGRRASATAVEWFGEQDPMLGDDDER